MSDIVEQLRDMAEMPLGGAPVDPLIEVIQHMGHEAADEILRLRAELAALREPAGNALVEVAVAEIARVIARTGMGRVFLSQSGPGDGDDIARAVLAAVLPRVRAEGWRTIESAPKDGTVVQLWSPDAARHGVMLGYFSDDWFEEWTDNFIDAEPTRWRPLPPPPDAAP